MRRPDVVNDLINTYLYANFDKGYLGYFEIPQEEAKEMASYIDDLETRVSELTKELDK